MNHKSSSSNRLISSCIPFATALVLASASPGLADDHSKHATTDAQPGVIFFETIV